MIARPTSVLILPPAGALMRLYPRLIEVERFLRRDVPERLADGALVWDLGAPLVGGRRTVDEVADDLAHDGLTTVRVPAGPRGRAFGARLTRRGLDVVEDDAATAWTVEHWLAGVARRVPDGQAVVAAPGTPATDRRAIGPSVALLPIRVGSRFEASVAAGLELARVIAERSGSRPAPIPFVFDDDDRTGAWWGIAPAPTRRSARVRGGMRSLVGRLHPERLARWQAFERRASAGTDAWA